MRTGKKRVYNKQKDGYENVYIGHQFSCGYCQEIITLSSLCKHVKACLDPIRQEEMKARNRMSLRKSRDRKAKKLREKHATIMANHTIA